jgi:hypothetical protein
MHGKRFLMKVLVGLFVIALLIGGASSLQRNAWMQGYMVGQLGAGADGGAAMPYMAYGLQGYGGPHLGGGLTILLGFGLLALLFMGFGRIFLGRSWAMQGGPEGGPQGGDEQSWQRMAQAHAERAARHWRHGPPSGCWDQADKIEPASGEPASGVPETGGTAATQDPG